MTREEIAKALRACSSDMPCSKCPAYYQKTDLRCVDYMMMCAADMLEQDEHFAGTGKMLPFTLDERFWCNGKKGFFDIRICPDDCEHIDGSGGKELEIDELPHNTADIDEICALRGRVENLTLYLQEAFALCPDELAVLDEWHLGLPGYAPPKECKSCKIDD